MMGGGIAMIDAQKQTPLKVWPAEYGGVIDVPAEQADDVLRELQSRGVRCWITGGFMSINGGPARGWVQYSKNESAERVQTVLDSIP